MTDLLVVAVGGVCMEPYLGCVNDYGECVVRTIILLILILYTMHVSSAR